MHIENAHIAYAVQQSSFSRQHTAETVRRIVVRPASPPQTEKPSASAPSPAKENAVEKKDLSNAAAITDPRWLQLIALVERLTGRKIKIYVPPRPEESAPSLALAQDASATTARPEIVFFIERKLTIETGEDLRFSAQGRIRTRDGREFEATLSFVLKYHYRHEQESIAVLVDGRPRDPLVLDLAGSNPGIAPAATFSFRFDLDADGQAEWLPALPAGQGFLALDHNGNGRIDDGRELFGPLTGAGFSELARHDSDGNGWIDEADAVFARLRVWLPADGKLLSLADLGIGALSLAFATTPHSYRNAEQVETARLKHTGIFLYETGEAATVREIDLFA